MRVVKNEEGTVGWSLRLRRVTVRENKVSFAVHCLTLFTSRTRLYKFRQGNWHTNSSIALFHCSSRTVSVNFIVPLNTISTATPSVY